MSDDAVVDFLEHFGVKGMKWGQRKQRPRGKIRRGATKANTALNAGSKVISEGEKKLIFLPQAYRNRAAANTQLRVLGEARAVNKDAKFRGKDLKKKPELKKAYHKEIETRAKKVYEEELGRARGEAVVDTINAIMSPAGDRMTFVDSKGRVRHAAANPDVLLTLKVTRDDLDHIVDLKVIDGSDELEQSDLVGDFLSHFGVKGMKWGQRKRRGSEPKVVSTEAKRADQILTKARTKGSKSLTNKELGDLNKRLQLEQQYSSMMQKKQPPSKAAMAFIGAVGVTAVQSAIKAEANKQIGSALSGAVAKAAARRAGAGA